MAVKANIDIIVNDEQEFNDVLKVFKSNKKPSNLLKKRIAELSRMEVKEDIFNGIR